MMKSFFLAIILTTITVSLCSSTYAAFDKVSALPAIAVCEVKSYGENSLRQEFLYTFEELLEDKLQSSQKVRVEQRLLDDPVLDDGSKLGIDNFFEQVHMNVLANGKEFEREKSNMKLVNYYDSLPQKPKHNSDVYFVDMVLRDKLKQVGMQQGAKYLLFCNIKSVDVILKNHSVSQNFQDLKGMKLKLDMDYHLVNAETGKVFEGSSFTDKTTQVFNIILAKYGKTFTVQQLLHTLLEVQAERVAEAVTKDGLKKVADDD